MPMPHVRSLGLVLLHRQAELVFLDLRRGIECPPFLVDEQQLQAAADQADRQDDVMILEIERGRFVPVEFRLVGLEQAGHQPTLFLLVEGEAQLESLHHADDVLHQQIALHLHDRCRVRANKQHREVIAGPGPRLVIVIVLVLVVFSVVETDLDRGAGFCQFVEVHAHFVERLTEVLVARDGPAYLQHVQWGVELDARLVLVGTARAIGKGTSSRVFPDRLEGILDLVKLHRVAQPHLAMQVDFKRGVVACHLIRV